MPRDLELEIKIDVEGDARRELADIGKRAQRLTTEFRQATRASAAQARTEFTAQRKRISDAMRGIRDLSRQHGDNHRLRIRQISDIGRAVQNNQELQRRAIRRTQERELSSVRAISRAKTESLQAFEKRRTDAHSLQIQRMRNEENLRERFANAELRDIRRNAREQQRGATRRFGGVSGGGAGLSTLGSLGVGGLAGRLGGGTFAAGAAGIGLIAFGRGVIDAASEAERLRLGLRAVTGSAESAARQLRDISRIEALPGVTRAEAARTSLRLRASGFDRQTTNRLITEFSNAAAASGAQFADAAEALRQLTQIQSTGRLTAENLNIILERLPIIRPALIQEFGTTVGGEVQKVLESRRQDFGDFVQTLLGRLEQGQRVSADTFSNATSNFDNAVNRLQRSLGRELLPALTRIVNALSSFVDFLGSTPGRILTAGAATGIGAAATTRIIQTVAQIAAGGAIGTGGTLAAGGAGTGAVLGGGALGLRRVIQIGRQAQAQLTAGAGRAHGINLAQEFLRAGQSTIGQGGFRASLSSFGGRIPALASRLGILGRTAIGGAAGLGVGSVLAGGAIGREFDPFGRVLPFLDDRSLRTQRQILENARETAAEYERLAEGLDFDRIRPLLQGYNKTLEEIRKTARILQPFESTGELRQIGESVPGALERIRAALPGFVSGLTRSAAQALAIQTELANRRQTSLAEIARLEVEIEANRAQEARIRENPQRFANPNQQITQLVRQREELEEQLRLARENDYVVRQSTRAIQERLKAQQEENAALQRRARLYQANPILAPDPEAFERARQRGRIEREAFDRRFDREVRPNILQFGRGPGTPDGLDIIPRAVNPFSQFQIQRPGISNLQDELRSLAPSPAQVRELSFFFGGLTEDVGQLLMQIREIQRTDGFRAIFDTRSLQAIYQTRIETSALVEEQQRLQFLINRFPTDLRETSQDFQRLKNALEEVNRALQGLDATIARGQAFQRLRLIGRNLLDSVTRGRADVNEVNRRSFRGFGNVLDIIRGAPSEARRQQRREAEDARAIAAQNAAQRRAQVQGFLTSIGEGAYQTFGEDILLNLIGIGGRGERGLRDALEDMRMQFRDVSAEINRDATISAQQRFDELRRLNADFLRERRDLERRYEQDRARAHRDFVAQAISDFARLLYQQTQLRLATRATDFIFDRAGILFGRGGGEGAAQGAGLLSRLFGGGQAGAGTASGAGAGAALGTAATAGITLASAAVAINGLVDPLKDVFNSFSFHNVANDRYALEAGKEAGRALFDGQSPQSFGEQSARDLVDNITAGIAAGAGGGQPMVLEATIPIKINDKTVQELVHRESILAQSGRINNPYESGKRRG